MTNTEATTAPYIYTAMSQTVAVSAQSELYVSVSGTDPLWSTATAGSADTYTVIVNNRGPSDVTGAVLNDAFPAALTNVTYTSSVLVGFSAANTGNTSSSTPANNFTLNDTLNLQAGEIVKYTVSGTVAANTSGNLTDTATVTAPASAPDSYTANNTSTFSAAVQGTTSASVVGRYLFYGHSSFDGNNASNATAPTLATLTTDIATDKVALLPGQTANFNNYSNFTNGVNGIAFDLAGAGGTVTASDLEISFGNTNTPGTGSSPGTGWAAGTTPHVSDFAGSGANGSDRIELTWADGTILNKWVQVTVKADATTALGAADIFYFGSAARRRGQQRHRRPRDGCRRDRRPLGHAHQQHQSRDDRQHARLPADRSRERFGPDLRPPASDQFADGPEADHRSGPAQRPGGRRRRWRRRDHRRVQRPNEQHPNPQHAGRHGRQPQRHVADGVFQPGTR